jgi:hypothetical protein
MLSVNHFSGGNMSAKCLKKFSNAFLIFCIVFVPQLLPAAQWDNGKLIVSANKHFIIHENGTPFFWIGNTAWEMTHFSKREEVIPYMEHRHKNGYTVVLTCALAEIQGLTRPNAYGFVPFKDQDPLKPVEEYWEHIDYVIQKAEENDIYIALVVTWGTWVHDTKTINESNAYQFGQWIGNRYKNKPNIIYILGCDREPYVAGSFDDTPVWNKLASGIKNTDPAHLMSYLPKSRSSSFFQDSWWLDFNIMQTGHEKLDNPVSYSWIESDYKLTPSKPTIDCEPRYEDHPVNWNDSNGFFTDFDARQTAYWSVFAGAFGCNYGSRGIISWYTPDYQATLWYGRPNYYWYEAMDRPGSLDMKHLSDLLKSRPFLSLVPDQTIISSPNPEDGGHYQAAKGDGYLFVYNPYGKTFSIDMNKLSGRRLKCYWYNPRDGIIQSAGTFKSGAYSKIFNPPGSEARGNDWILVIDDASKKYPQPGKPVNQTPI